MKRYRCHKVVQAAPIIGHGDGYVIVHDDAGNETTIAVPEGFDARDEGPCNGDYLVQYEGGYLSWSPKAVFEAGYTEEAAKKYVAAPEVRRTISG